MGRTLDVLLGRTTKHTARLKSLLPLAVTRLAVLRGHRQVRCGQARGDVEQLLRLGHPDRALLRAEQVIREQNMLDVFGMLEAYCNLIAERAALVDAHRDCPDELREAATGLVYAASRCGDLPELQEIRGLLAAKFGRNFASAAADLHTDCGINTKIVQKLSTKQPSLESRRAVLREIAADKGIAVPVHEAFHEDLGSLNQGKKKKKQNEEPRRTPQADMDRDSISPDSSAHRYKDVEAAAQAAFESAATAASAAKAAIELSRANSSDPDDRRKPGRTHADGDMAKKETTLHGGDELAGPKKSERVRHVQNYSSEIEVLPETEESHGDIAESELKHREQTKSRPLSVRTTKR